MDPIALLVLVGLISLYFLPTQIACKRKVLGRWTIFWLNLMFGWTVIGWVVTLLWAALGQTKDQAEFYRLAVQQAKARTLLLAACAIGVAAFTSNSFAQEPPAVPSGARVGPSFPCPSPRDPLAELICESPELSRLDLTFVQTYQAYRQQLTADGQKALRSESVEFGRAVRAGCGIAYAQATPTSPIPPPAPASAAACVQQAYERQRQIWAAHLTGAAAQEAQRSIEQHLGLQRDLQALGLIPASDAIDGVYGPDTRAAIMSFQQTMGLPVTGPLGEQDALVLHRQASSHADQPAQVAQNTAAVAAPVSTRSPWETFYAEALNAGVRVSLSVTDGACKVSLEVQDPETLSRAARAQQPENGSAAAEDTNAAFKAMLLFLRTQVAAKTIHAVYAERQQVDHCSFVADGFTQDVYGRDVRQPLFTFEFDRATYAKIVWDRFDPANLPKILPAFAYGAFASERLRQADTTASAASDAPAAAETRLIDAASSTSGGPAGLVPTTMPPAETRPGTM